MTLVSLRTAIFPYASADITDDQGLVRVEMAPALGRGSDPSEVARQLRDAGVAVELRQRRTWLPWQSGQIISYEFSTGAHDWAPREGARFDGENLLEADFSAAGVVSSGSGALIVDPKRFEGEVRLDVGDLPF